MRKFVVQRENERFDAEEGVFRRHLLNIECPEEASTIGLMDALADKLDPARGRFTANNQRAVRRAAYEGLRIADCRAIAIDNINNFSASRGHGMVVTLNAMRGLTADLHLSFLCTSTVTADSVLRTDAQLVERFAFVELKPLILEGEFPPFVRTLVSTYPLRRCRTLSEEIIGEVYAKVPGPNRSRCPVALRSRSLGRRERRGIHYAGLVARRAGFGSARIRAPCLQEESGVLVRGVQLN